MSGFNQQARTAAAKTNGTELQGRISSSGSNFLPEGTFDVRVASLDRNNLEDNKVTFRWEDANGKSFNDQMFVMEQDRKTGAWQVDWRFGLMLGGLVPSTEVLDAYLAEVHANNPAVLDLFIGMRCKLTLERTRGYVIQHKSDSGTEWYESVDVKSKDVLFRGATIDDVKRTTEAEGFKKAYINATRYTPTHADENIEQFAQGLAAQRQPKAAPFPFGTKKAVDKDQIPF